MSPRLDVPATGQLVAAPGSDERNPPVRYFATAPLGVDSLLAEELRGLGALSTKPHRAGVEFTGDLRLAYRVCLWSRLANRVLLPLAWFAARTPEQLYAGVRDIDWCAHLDPEASIAVDFVSQRSAISHTLFGAQKVKDAIVDRCRADAGSRPSVDLVRPDLRINAYLHRDEVTLSIDLSGDSLHRRGYRLAGGSAPLKENLAAALLLRAGWPAIAEAGGALLDPLCGSGTLPIEAALMAADRAPGLLRTRFGFFGWRGHDPALWAALSREAEARAVAGRARLPAIVGHDRDREAVRNALANVERAGLRGCVHIERKELNEARPPGQSGLLIANPPYGERLGQAAELEALYTALGDLLRGHFGGWRASVFTGNPELAFRLGIRATRHYTFYNGALACRLFNFEVAETRFFQPRNPGVAPPPAWRRRLDAVQLGAGGAAMLINRLQKNLRRLGRWARQEGISCYRLYDADLPEYAFAVDLYRAQAPVEPGAASGAAAELWVHVQEYEAPADIDPVAADRRRLEALAALRQVLEVPAERLVLKLRRRQRGTAQYERLDQSSRFLCVAEGGLRFWVNLEDYLDTGLFLDHRPTRGWIRQQARGKTFLNLFAYTGSATVYAAAGGALATTSVDLSRTYLDWARRNLELNGFAGDRHRLIQADCLEWLAETAATRHRYDLIFLDPPTFSSSKRMHGTLDIQRDHVRLIRLAMALLAPGGLLLFTTNQRRFRLDQAGLSGLRITDLSRQTLPRDFERNPRIHRGWLIEPGDGD